MRVALLTGEAGIGKSRIAAHVERFAADNQFLVWHGSNFEQDRRQPYALLRELTSRYRNPHVSHNDSLLSPLKFTTSLPDTSANGAQARQRLFDEVVEFVVHAADTQPLLFVLEDLHWSDDATMDLLLYLVQRTHAVPVFYLLTLRSTETHPALRHLLAEFEREHSAVEFSLPPLTNEEVSLMLGAIFQQAQPVCSEFAEAIATLTDGNPFFIEQVCKALVLSGEIFATPGGWSRKAIAELQIPRTVQDAVAQSTEHLSPVARDVLLHAAVIGRRVRFALLENLMHKHESELLPHVKELLATELLVEDSADELSFRHELVRQAVYSSLLLRERRTFHREVAETIERLDARALEARTSELAYHFERAQVWQKAFEYSLRAGEQARALYAPQSAAEQYSRALNAAQQLGQPSPIGVLRARGSVFETLGDFENARADLEAVLAQAVATDDQPAVWS